MTDAELLRRFVAEHHEDAFSELVRRRIDLVYAAALRQLDGDAHRAHDITQQVFIDLARKAPTLASHPSLLAWLYTSTHYAALKLIRTEQRRQRREEEACAMNQLTEPTGPEVDWENLRRVIDGAMHELDDRDRQIVLMRFFDRQTFAAIGAELGVTENAAQKCAERALDRLHALLARRGITSTSTALAAAFAHQVVVAAPEGLATSVATTALVEAAATGSGGLLFPAAVNLMNTSKLTLGLAAAIILCVGTGAYLSVRSARAEAMTVGMERETAELHAQLGATQRPMAATRPPSPAAVSLPAANTAPPTSTASTTAGKSAPLSAAQKQARDSVLRDLIADPKFNQLKTQFGASYVRLDWGLYCTAVGLTVERRAQFEALTTQAIAEAWQARMNARLAGHGESDPNLRELLRQARVRLEDGIRTLAGEGGLQRFLDFERMDTPANEAAWLGQLLYATDEPLTPAQAVQVADILARHSPQFRDGRNASWRDIEWADAIAEAARILTPRQLWRLEDRRLTREADREAELAKKSAGGKSP